MNNRDFWQSNLASEQTTVDGKLQRTYNDGRKEITFPNGSIKEILKNGHTIVKFPNGDKKEDFPDGKVVYHFSEARVVQTNHTDGAKEFQFENG